MIALEVCHVLRLIVLSSFLGPSNSKNSKLDSSHGHHDPRDVAYRPCLSSLSNSPRNFPNFRSCFLVDGWPFRALVLLEMFDYLGRKKMEFFIIIYSLLTLRSCRFSRLRKRNFTIVGAPGKRHSTCLHLILSRKRGKWNTSITPIPET